MLKKHFLLLGLVLCFGLLSNCASRQELIPYPKKEALLFERANNFYKSLANKKYNQMYAMLSADNRADTPKDEYVANLTKFFSTIVIDPRQIEVIKNDGKEGSTRAIVALKIETKTVIICQQLDWIWEQENWYIVGDGADCIVPSGNFK